MGSVTPAPAESACVDRQASIWFVRLEDEPHDPDLRAAFAAWLAASPTHRMAWEETQQLAPLIAAAAPLGDAGDAMAGVVVRLGGRRPRYRLAAAAALAACLAWLIGPDLRLHLEAQQIASTGEVRLVTLADGSRTWLAPGAAIAFDSSAGQRRLRLMRGTAYFDVARDAAHPFQVETAGGRVRVLGTAFEIASGEQTRVAVARGRVEVADAQGNVLGQLGSGGSITFGARGAPEQRPVRPDRIATWKEGELIVNDRPVGEVIEALRPWFHGLIIARGAGLTRDRVTGLYNLRDPDAALAALGQAHRFRVSSLTPWVRIVTVD
jgi:transmembrane sensor